MPGTQVSPGVLYVVATPIGNLDDISSRALAILAGASVIAAEDTRHTGRLLAHFGISTPLLSLHEHNEEGRARSVLARLAAGHAVALVSDAGTPLVSDPGYRLVAAARAGGHAVTTIPGPCAAVAALSVAGLPTNRFHFEGFLPARAAARDARLRELQACPDTMIFYESVHRVAGCLAAMADIFGGTRQGFVARELTKRHEAAYAGDLGVVQRLLAADPGAGKGEFTVVVAGAPREAASHAEIERVTGVLAAELPGTQAARLAARILGVPRRAAYRAALGTGDEPAED